MDDPGDERVVAGEVAVEEPDGDAGTLGDGREVDPSGRVQLRGRDGENGGARAVSPGGDGRAVCGHGSMTWAGSGCSPAGAWL